MSRPGANKLLHFLMALMSSSFENRAHVLTFLLEISSRSWKSTSWDYMELKELCRAFYRSSNSIQDQPLNKMDLIAGSLFFLIQFISSYGPYFLLAISSILLLKNILSSWLYFWIFSNLLNFRIVGTCWYPCNSLYSTIL